MIATCRPIEISNRNISKKLFKDVQFFSCTPEGAMGDKGGLTFVTSDGRVYYGNYIHGDIDLDKLNKAFPILKEYSFSNPPEGWHFIYMGMGNHLLVRDDIYETFDKRYKTLWEALPPDEKEIDIEVYLYKYWPDIAVDLIADRAGRKEKERGNMALDHNSELWRMFNDIICGEGSIYAPILRAAILNPQCSSKEAFYDLYANERDIDPLERSFIEGCWNFVDYQRKEICGGNDELFQQEGFTIGSPWHGDIKNAPILFLGANPAITPQCLFPRWHPDKDPSKDKFTLGGNISADVLECQNEDGTLDRKYHNMIQPEDIMEFLTNRFQESSIEDDKDSTINVWVVADKEQGICKPKSACVRYWKGIRDVMEALLQDTQNNSADRTRRLMKPVLSAEIIPFGSMESAHVDDALLDYCWERFTRPLLRNCGAKLLFLVSGKTQRAFCRSIGIKSITNSDIFTGSHPYVNRYGEKYTIIAVNQLGIGGWIRNNFTNSVNELLKSSNPIVKEALTKAKALYNN